MDEERHPVLGRQFATRHGDELQVREQERAKKIGRLLPYPALGQIRNEDAAMIHRVRKVEFRCHLPKNIAQVGEAVNWPTLLRMGLAASA